MNKKHTSKTIQVVVLIIFPIFALVVKATVQERNIDIAGLVVDAQTLLPIDGAAIYDAEHHLLGTSDAKGYYKIRLIYKSIGALNFKLKVVKHGFETFLQHENWANLPGNAKAVFYFGLKKQHTTSTSFSSLKQGALTYEGVYAGLGEVHDQKSFDNKLAQAKAGNQNIFIRIDNSFYIVDDTGWIKINTESDLVAVNDKQTLTADKLNGMLKRKNIKRMTPIAGQNAKFAIYTM